MRKLLLFPLQFLAKFALVVLLVGCVAARQDGTVLVPSHADEPGAASSSGGQIRVQAGPENTLPPKVALPNVPLSSGMLYDMLVAEIAGQRGQPAITASNYLKLARSTRDPRIAERAAQALVFTGDKQGALEALKLWVELDPENLDARQGLVIFLLRNGQGDTALPHLEKLLAGVPAAPKPAANTMPGSPEFGTDQGHGFMMIAALLGREQDKQAALRLMGKFAEAHNTNPDALLSYSNLALTFNDLKSARTSIDQALQIKPGWPSAVALRARILQTQGDTSQAIASMEEATQANPKDLMLRLSYARLLVDAKKFDEARAQFTAMAKQMPDNAEALFSLGLLSLQITQLDDAAGYFNQVIKLDKFIPESSYYLGQIAESKKQYGDAVTLYRAVSQGDGYLDAQLRIVGLLAKQGDIAAARTHLRTIQVQDPQQVKLLFMAEADLLAEEKHYVQAMEIYNNALADMPKDNTLLYGRAMLAEKMDKLDILEQDLHNILEREPDNARALNALGYTLADRTNRYEEALGYVKRALEINPQDAATLDSMGWIHYRLGNTQQAIQYLQTAYKLDANAEIAAHLGEVLWISGDQPGARKVWEDALKAEPKDETLLTTMKRFKALISL